MAESQTPRHVAMTWARRLKRAFGIAIDAVCALRRADQGGRQH
jgi:hypothetical protein